jgi:hypothetical protein
MIRSQSQTLITGVYRTGTEFIAQHLGAHPKLDVSMYRVNAPRFILDRYDPISDPTQTLAALRDLADRLLERYQIVLDQPAVLKELETDGPITYARLYNVVMSVMYLAGEKVHWAEKNQLLWREIPWFVNNMPNGKAILVLRDPRSVLISFKKYTYAPSPAYLGAIFNCLDAMASAARYETELGPDRFIWVRYEDFALRPIEETQRLWAFLGLEGGPAGGSAPGDWKDAYGRPWHANSSFQPNDPGVAFDVNASIHRWKKGLSKEEIALAEVVSGSYLERFGYEPSGIPVDWPAMLRLFMNDEKMLAHFRRWLYTGEGIQAFPTDPLKPENWRRD